MASTLASGRAYWQAGSGVPTGERACILASGLVRGYWQAGSGVLTGKWACLLAIGRAKGVHTCEGRAYWREEGGFAHFVSLSGAPGVPGRHTRM
jgi:hypothetical protein